MIRSLVLVSFFAPALAFASSAPCGAPSLAPLPASVPAPEMARGAALAVASCVNLQDYLARLRRPTVAPTPAGAYVPKTAHDNTPWRFNMSQDGRQMTADEFDAWMKAKGIRVATGRPGASRPTAVPAAGGPATTAPAAAPTLQCVPSSSVTC